MLGCDMGRIHQQPLWVSMGIVRALPRDRIVSHRRANFLRYLGHFQDVDSARPLVAHLPPDAVPYVFPLWVDDADRVYGSLRRAGAPVFRWDHIWPGTPRLPGDHGLLWSRHVLQMLCHQDLSFDDIDRVSAFTAGQLGRHTAVGLAEGTT